MYHFKNYDEILLTFVIEKPGLEERVTKIEYINEDASTLFPPGLEVSPDGLTKWLQRRSIPNNRDYVHEILASCGLKQGDYRAILDVCKGLSVNDSYWVVHADFKGEFKDYNLWSYA